MKKTGIGKLGFYGYNYGSVTQLMDREETAYIKPKSVILRLNGERLLPTQYDAHGNPQIGGIAGCILIWKIRQLVRDGVFESEYSAFVEYSYETTQTPINNSFSNRLPKLDVCQICGKRMSIYELDKGTITELDDENILVHRECSREYYRLETIDKITQWVGLAFNCYDIDEDLRAKWGKGLSYDIIPNEYCSQNCCAHRPWFMFHTPVGDIKVGWRKRVISITWMENFTPFDMSIFDDEKTTKYIGERWFDGKSYRNGPSSQQRTIHAWGYEKLFEYLVKVHQEVLPNNKK